MIDEDQVVSLRNLYFELVEHAEVAVDEGGAFVGDVMRADREHLEKQTEGRLFAGDAAPRKMSANDAAQLKEGIDMIQRGATWARWALAARDAAITIGIATGVPDADVWPIGTRTRHHGQSADLDAERDRDRERYEEAIRIEQEGQERLAEQRKGARR